MLYRALDDRVGKSLRRHLRLALLFALLPTVAPAATLDVPSQGDRLSGIGVIHGWKCDPQHITVSVDGSAPIPALAPYPRADTGEVCGNAGWNGFFTFVNWAIFGDGPHTITASDNGFPFATRTFTVTTLGEEFVTGVEKRATIDDFPAPGESVELEWNQSTQHFEIVGNTATEPGEDEEPDEPVPTASVYGICFAGFKCPEGSENSNALVSQNWCSREETCVESAVQAWCGDIPPTSPPVTWYQLEWIPTSAWPDVAEENEAICTEACTHEDAGVRSNNCYPDFAADTGLPPWGPFE